MNILTIEKARNELFDFLENTSSRRLKLKKISEFFGLLLDGSSPNLAESYLIELLPQYIEYLKTYSPFGVEPGFTQSIIDVNEKLQTLNGLNDREALTEYYEQLIALNEGMKGKLHLLFEMLNGRGISLSEPKVLFPVIEEVDENDFILGAIDSLTIKIGKAKDRDKFIIVPSESEKDKRLEEQIKISWMNAKEYCKKYVKKISEYHEVIISFDEHLGIYKGDSVGTALVVGFIEELLRFYNSQTILRPILGTAFTGGVAESGKVNKVSKEIVEKKVEIAFYSNCQTFVIPKEDEPFALYKLGELSKLYPKHKFKIVGVSNLDEILLRRDLVDIKKQKLIVRTSKFVKKNWVSAVVTVLLAVLVAFLFVMDFDDNPALVTVDGQFLQVKNKNGKLLWTNKLGPDLTRIENVNILKLIHKFEDLNNDGLKELIICHEYFSQGVDTFNPGRIVCFDHRGNQVWQYVFDDSVLSKGKWQPNNYSTYLISLRTEANIKVLYALAANAYYAGALFRLNAVTGERLKGTLWNAGHYQDGTIGDFNEDGKTELVLAAINNGFERCTIASIDLEKVNGQLPTSDLYKFPNIPAADYNKLILLPVSDYAKYLGARFNIITRGGLRILDDEFSMVTKEDPSENSTACMNYRFDLNLNCIDIECSDVLQVKRDSLVAQNKLSKPYTNTLEYEMILRNDIVVK